VALVVGAVAAASGPSGVSGEAGPSKANHESSERSAEARSPQTGVQVEQQIRNLSKEVQSLRESFEQRQTTEALASEVQGVLQALPQREAALLGQVQQIAERAANIAVARVAVGPALPGAGVAAAAAPSEGDLTALGGESAQATVFASGAEAPLVSGGALAAEMDGVPAAPQRTAAWEAQVEGRLSALEASARAPAGTGGGQRGAKGPKAQGAGDSPTQPGKKRSAGAVAAAGGAPKVKKAVVVVPPDGATSGQSAGAALASAGTPARGSASGSAGGVAEGVVFASPAADAAAEAAAAVAQIQARAEELERQFEEDNNSGSGDGGTGSADGDADGGRVARLEARVVELAVQVEALRTGFNDGISLGGSDLGMGEVAGTATRPASGDPAAMGSAIPEGVVSATTPTGSRRTSASGTGPNHSQLMSMVRTLADEVTNLREVCIKELAAGLHSVKQQLAGSTGRGLKEEITSELDRRSETRLATVWTELKGFADAASTRADQVERSLGARVVKVENGFSEMLKRKKGEKELEQLIKEQQKQIEWVTWRISWLEWATKGEERGFARPLDSKAILPPPSTAAATAFAQPLTEDVELWAREVNGGGNGRQRLRRPIQVPIVEPGGGSSPGHALATSLRSLSQPNLHGQQANQRQFANSHGRLPTIA